VSIWPGRRAKLPAYARSWLAPDERVLTFATTAYGDLVLATPRGLWIEDRGAATAGAGPGGPAGQLHSWESIVTARWAGDVLTVTTAEEVAPQIMKRRPAISLPLPEPADLPRVVRQRIDRSVAASHRRAISPTATVLLVGRRVSGRDGLFWYAVFDRESDADDPRARELAISMLKAAAATMSPLRPDSA